MNGGYKSMNGEIWLCCLFALFIAVHRFGWPNHNFVAAFGANVGFARSAGKTVATRTVEQGFIPRLSAMRTGNCFILVSHCLNQLFVLMALINFTNPNKTTWVKMMVAPEGILAK